jgi:hypothetical protein
VTIAYIGSAVAACWYPKMNWKSKNRPRRLLDQPIACSIAAKSKEKYHHDEGLSNSAGTTVAQCSECIRYCTERKIEVYATAPVQVCVCQRKDCCGNKGMAK